MKIELSSEDIALINEALNKLDNSSVLDSLMSPAQRLAIEQRVNQIKEKLGNNETK